MPEENHIPGGLAIRKVLSKEEIEEAVAGLAEQISADYEGKTPVLVCVLLGARPFFEDLAARMTVEVEKRSVRVSSYREKTRPGSLKLLSDIESGVEGRDVIVVEDLVDTSRTAEFVLGRMESKKPRSLRLCALIDKRAEGAQGPGPHYSGFRMSGGFLVGYGMDYGGKGRHLEDIYMIWE